MPTFLSYATEKKLTKHPEEFGKGAIEGVAGPEAANNASAAGTLLPLLTLGPAHHRDRGDHPGRDPELRHPARARCCSTNEPDLVWALLASLVIANLLLLVINLPMAPLWAKVLQIPRPYLYAGILFFATLGAYTVNFQAFDVALLLVFGALGPGDATVRPPGAAPDRRPSSSARSWSTSSPRRSRSRRAT